MKRIVNIMLVLVASAMILVGCSTQKQEDIMGRVLLNVNPSIAIAYKNDGTIASVEALNKDGETILVDYTDYVGKTSSAVVSELVKKIGDAGYLVDDVEVGKRHITIELEGDSKLPNETFMRDIAKATHAYLSANGFDNNIRYEHGHQDDDFSDYFDTDYDDTNYDSPYDDKNNTQDSPYDDHDDSPYDDKDDSPYDDKDDSPYDDKDDDSDYDDSNYDDSDYDN